MALFASGQALGGLTENQVMLLYNSQNSESSDIAAIYLQFHPDVIVCDLNIIYPPNNQFENCGITNRYITPCKFKEIFIDGPSNFLTCLEQNPQILSIATTRGLPAAISNILQVTLFLFLVVVAYNQLVGYTLALKLHFRGLNYMIWDRGIWIQHMTIPLIHTKRMRTRIRRHHSLTF